MTSIITPNLGLTVPTPGSEPGPAYATEISDDQIIIDGHDHSSGKGLPVHPAGLDINSDLTFQSNNATNLRSARLSNNSSTLNGIGDINCVYDVLGNLWFNNGSGTSIQLTNGASINISQTTVYSTHNITNDYAIIGSDPFVLIGADPTSNTISMTLPLANSVAVGRLYIVKDTTGQSATNNISVFPAGSDTLDGSGTALIIADAFWSVGFVCDGASNWRVLKWNKFTYLSGEQLTFKSGSLIEGVPALDTTAQLNFLTGSKIIGSPVIGGAANFSLGGFNTVTGILSYLPVAVSVLNSPYTISALSPISIPAILLLVNTTTACTINLPGCTGVGLAPEGMIIIIKDVSGNAATNNITVVPNAASVDKIEGLTNNYLIQAGYGSITLTNCHPAITKNWALI